MRLPPPFLVAMAAAALLGIVVGSGGGGDDDNDSVKKGCGGVLTASRGVITTPNFPGPPPVPLHCRWVINASWAEDRDVTVYLTQQYVLDGLVIYDYFKYGDKIDSKQIFGSGGDQHPISIEYVQSNRPYVGVELTLPYLENNHLRVLQDLREVYGFNITYEVTNKGEPARNSCSPIICSFVGQCRVSDDFRNYSCDCPKKYAGPNCALGPMCRENPCKNGGICRTAGTESIVCQCPANYSGVFCQYPPIEEEVRECQIESDASCPSGSVVKPGRLLYTVSVSLQSRNSNNDTACEGTMLLASLTNIQSFNDFRNNLSESLNSTINKRMAHYEAYDFHIVDLTPGRKVTFQFIIHEKHSQQVSEILKSLVKEGSQEPLFKWTSKFTENGTLGNCTDWDILLSESEMSIRSDPALYLQRVALNYNGPLPPTSQVVFSCVVVGSPNVSFSWYKRNHLVIPGQCSRIWTHTSVDPEGTITSLLGVDNLSVLDDGRWTCQVRDGRLQQSRSVDLYVLQGPNVRMQPLATSAPKGEKVFLSCLLSNRDRHQIYTYSWSRNGVPFHSGGEHVYEELNYPNGCLLRIQNINESATYTCHVKSSVGKASASARVEVVFENSSLCESEEDWPEVPVGAVAMIECPEGREGSVASRRCTFAPDKTHPQWSEADYSACLVGDAILLQEDLREIGVGYAPSKPSQVLRQLYHVIRNRTTLRSGQGEAVLAVAMEAWQMSGDHPEMHYQMLQIIDFLLSIPRALASHKVVNDISKVCEKAAVAQMKLSDAETSRVLLHHLSVSVTRPNSTEVLRLEESRSRWFASFSFPELKLAPLPIPFVVFEFQSLKDIIPYNSRLKTAGNVFYEILSTIAVSSVPKIGDAKRNGTDIVSPHLTTFETTFEHLFFNVSNFLDENKDDDVTYWNITCAFSRNFTSPMQWDLGSCVTSISRLNEEDSSSMRWLPWRRANAFLSLQSKVSVRCLCPVPGSNAVFLAGFAEKPDSGVPSVAVILALWCCVVQATASLLFPFVVSWRENKGKPSRPESLNGTPKATTPVTTPATTHSVQNSTTSPASSESLVFVAFRVMSCTNTILVAIVMAFTMCKWDTIFPGVLLQCLLILSISLPTAHLYLVAVELGAFSALPVGNLCSRQYSRTHGVAFILSIGPVVVFVALWLSVRDLRTTLSQSWTSWLDWGEPVCWAIAIPSTLIATAGVVMAAMGRKFATITTYRKHVHNHLRYGLLVRLCAILVCQMAFLASSIVYTSAPGVASHVALVFASFLLGYSLFLCYVLRLEKQWPPLLSAVWCQRLSADSADGHPQIARTSTSTDTPPLPDCRSKWSQLLGFFSRRKKLDTSPNPPTTPALESPDSLRPLIVSSKESQRPPTWPQSNGVQKKSTRTPSSHPLQTPFKPEEKFCSSARAEDPAETSLLPLRLLDSPAVKKTSNGYLYMRGKGTKMTCKAVVHSGSSGAKMANQSQVINNRTNSVPQRGATNPTAQPQYQFRRRFLRLDDIEESSSAS